MRISNLVLLDFVLTRHHQSGVKFQESLRSQFWIPIALRYEGSGLACILPAGVSPFSPQCVWPSWGSPIQLKFSHWQGMRRIYGSENFAFWSTATTTASVLSINYSSASNRALIGMEKLSFLYWEHVFLFYAPQRESSACTMKRLSNCELGSLFTPLSVCVVNPAGTLGLSPG